MSETVLSAPDSNGMAYALPVNELPHAFTYGNYGGADLVITDTVVFRGITFIQTYTRNGSGDVTNLSRYIPQ